MTIPTEWFTVDEAAAYLGVSRRTVYKLTKEGRLRTYLLGKERTRRFRKEDLDRALRPLETSVGRQEIESLTALSATADPVLAELWSNAKDAAYDAL
jgi:excisionase family DNA binding protein